MRRTIPCESLLPAVDISLGRGLIFEDNIWSLGSIEMVDGERRADVGGSDS